ncbi:hypothetical protein [Haladaptatus caseinilyticus]|uniref:hypothetical protein n=1 Tax=Haladaptatus caseinilyticus TaxID=2993314 RepID=UPI00224A4A5B|nr:hypothetical protein [Haladaptatus caseinilyticus]
MRRRTLLGGLLAGTGALSGCLGRSIGASKKTQPPRNDASTTKPTTPFETEVNDTHVTLEILDRQMPAPDESVNGEFDCDASRVVITGWLRPPNGCHELVFESLERHTEPDEAPVALTTESNESDDTTCEGIEYKYQLTLAFENDLPDVIRVQYESLKDDSVDSFEVQNESCR